VIYLKGVTLSRDDVLRLPQSTNENTRRLGRRLAVHIGDRQTVWVFHVGRFVSRQTLRLRGEKKACSIDSRPWAAAVAAAGVCDIKYYALAIHDDKCGEE
jgi:hypothetical protein